jgi:hypothetical protein
MTDWKEFENTWYHKLYRAGVGSKAHCRACAIMITAIANITSFKPDELDEIIEQSKHYVRIYGL